MMKILDFIFFNENDKKLTWRNRNYFFGVTIFIVLMNIFIYAVYGGRPVNFAVTPKWGDFSVANLFQALVNSYSHSNWQHVLLNMLCFFVVGLYLERKQGSLRFLLFMFMMSVFTAFAVCTNDLSLSWQGFSGVNFGLYSYIVVEFIFILCKKTSRTKYNVISGAIVTALIYFAMCFNGGTHNIGFEWYPYDLLNNLGHASGFAAGFIFSAYENIRSLLNYKAFNQSAQ